MLHTAHKLPSLEAWHALEHARVLPEIAKRANKALHGEVATNQDSPLDLEEFALPELAGAERLTAWSSIVGQALTEYTNEGSSSCTGKPLSSTEHPLAIGIAILQERLMGFTDLGFASPHALARAAASCAEIFYCISRCDEYWLSNEGRLSLVSRNIHGDMHVAQAQLGSERPTQPLTELTQTDLFVSLHEYRKQLTLIQQGALPPSPIAPLNQWQDWSPMLGALLIFARKVGMGDIHEIKNYPTVLEELDRSAAATAEAMFGTDMMFLPSFVREHSVLDLGSPLVEFPNTFCAGPGEGAAIYMAVFYDQKLWFPRTNHLTKRAREAASPESSFAECLRQQLLSELQNETAASDIVRFSPGDLPHALRATYRLFCRDPRRVEALLRLFSDPAALDYD